MEVLTLWLKSLFFDTNFKKHTFWRKALGPTHTCSILGSVLGAEAKVLHRRRRSSRLQDAAG